MGNQQIDGVLYPSLAVKSGVSGPSMNLALKPASADKFFEPFECWMIEIVGETDSDPKGLVAHCIKIAKGFSEGRDILWD